MRIILQWAVHHLQLRNILVEQEVGSLIHQDQLHLLWIIQEVYRHQHLMMKGILRREDHQWILNLLQVEEEKGIEIYHLGHSTMDSRENTIFQSIRILTMTTG